MMNTTMKAAETRRMNLMIDDSEIQIDLESVKLVQKNKTIAEGSLVMVDDEIAIQIERVS